MVFRLDPAAHPRHALDKREHTRLIFILFTDARVDLSVTEFGTGIRDLRAFFDTPAENLLVLTDSFCFRVTMELLWQINILDWQQTEIHVIVQGLSADYFITTELAALKCFAVAGSKDHFPLLLKFSTTYRRNCAVSRQRYCLWQFSRCSRYTRLPSSAL